MHMNKYLGKLGLFVGGMIFGTAGISILSGKDARKVYTHATAAVLRGKDAVVRQATVLKENCEDIYSDAVDLNEKRYEEEDAEELELAKAIVEAAAEAEKEAEAAAEEPEA